jgi:hypothetical protein
VGSGSYDVGVFKGGWNDASSNKARNVCHVTEKVCLHLIANLKYYNNLFKQLRDFC